MASTHVQGKSTSVASGVTTTSITLTSAPTTGNVVWVGIAQETSTAGSTITSVKDSNNNSYTVTPNSPSILEAAGSAGQCWLAYWLSASGASATITVTWGQNTTGAVCIFVDEFNNSGQTAAFDVDAGAGATTGAMNTTPAITPAAAGGLLYSVATVQGSITAPTQGSTAGNWTGAGPIVAGDQAEYILNSGSTSQAINYTQTGSAWSAMIGAIKFSGGGVTHGLFEPSGMNGISTGGQFFANPIGRMRLKWGRKGMIWMPQLAAGAV